jgi:hypothetical protein
MIIDTIAAIVGGLGILIGAIFGAMLRQRQAEEKGRASALRDFERAQADAYRATRERIDDAPILTDPDLAAEFLRHRRKNQD